MTTLKQFCDLLIKKTPETRGGWELEEYGKKNNCFSDKR